jgi:hypothetical protein
MPSSIPTPLAAALGLVPTVLGGVRRLPGRAVQLPVLAVSSALSGAVAARREYDDLAERGERLLARLRGTSFDELEDSVEDALKGTPLAAPYDRVEDALEDAGAAVRTTLKRGTRGAGKQLDRAADVVEDAAQTVGARSGKAAKAAKAAKAKRNGAGNAAEATAAVVGQVQEAAGTAVGTAGEAVQDAGQTVQDAGQTLQDAGQTVQDAGAAVQDAGQTAQDAGQTAQDASVQEELPTEQQPKGRPTPKATEPDATRVATAADPDVTETVEQVSTDLGGPVLNHDELPLPDYDHMTLGSLRGRMRSLTVEQLVQIRDYEKAHADRLPVVTMLDNRIAKLATDASGEQPSGTAPDSPTPEQRTAAAGAGSVVTPATSGPAMNPPSQGVPTNPAQPRSTG